MKSRTVMLLLMGCLVVPVWAQKIPSRRAPSKELPAQRLPAQRPALSDFELYTCLTELSNAGLVWPVCPSGAPPPVSLSPSKEGESTKPDNRLVDWGWGLGGGVLGLVVGGGGGFALGRWKRRKQKMPEQIPESQRSPLSELSDLTAESKKVQQKLDEVQRYILGLPRVGLGKSGELSSPERDRKSHVEERGRFYPEQSVAEPVGPGAEQALLQVANRWWREGGDRARLRELIQGATEYQFDFYIMERLDEGLGEESANSYAFQQQDGTPEWLWYRIPGTSPAEFLAVPLDSRRFEGTVGALLPRLFEGIPEAPRYFRFEQVRRACRLREIAGQPGFYRPISRGVLQIALKGTAGSLPQSSSISVPPSSSLSPAVVTPPLEQVVRQALQPQQKALGELQHLLVEIRAETRSDVGLEPELRQIRDRIGAIEELLRAQLVPGDGYGVKRPKDLTESTRSSVSQRVLTSPPAPAPLLGAPSRIVRPSEVGGPEEILERLQPFLSELTGEFDLGPEISQYGPGEAYLSRLSALEEMARQILSQPRWSVTMVHLRLSGTGTVGERGEIAFHPILGTSLVSGSATVRCSCGEKLVQNMLFQLFLRLDPPTGDACAITLPAGPFSVSNFPAAYQRLLRGSLPTGTTRIERVAQPAVLRRVGVDGDTYEVLSLLEPVFR